MTSLLTSFNLTPKDTVVQNVARDFRDALEGKEGFQKTPQNVEEMIKKQGGLLRFMLSQKSREEILKQFDVLAKLRNSSTQTPVDYATVACQTEDEDVDFLSNVGDLIHSSGKKRGNIDFYDPKSYVPFKDRPKPPWRPVGRRPELELFSDFVS